MARRKIEVKWDRCSALRCLRMSGTGHPGEIDLYIFEEGSR